MKGEVNAYEKYAELYKAMDQLRNKMREDVRKTNSYRQEDAEKLLKLRKEVLYWETAILLE